MWQVTRGMSSPGSKQETKRVDLNKVTHTSPRGKIRKPVKSKASLAAASESEKERNPISPKEGKVASPAKESNIMPFLTADKAAARLLQRRSLRSSSNVPESSHLTRIGKISSDSGRLSNPNALVNWMPWKDMVSGDLVTKILTSEEIA